MGGKLEIGTDCTFVLCAGSSDLNTAALQPTSGVDTAGFNGCCFVVSLGSITEGGGSTITVKGSEDDGSADDFTALDGVEVVVSDDDDDSIVYVDVDGKHPRYLALFASASDAALALESVVAILYGSGAGPVTQPSAKVSGGGRWVGREPEIA